MVRSARTPPPVPTSSTDDLLLAFFRAKTVERTTTSHRARKVWIQFLADRRTDGQAAPRGKATDARAAEECGAASAAAAMGLLSNWVERSEIRPGDHIYTCRAVYAYTHHGKYPAAPSSPPLAASVSLNSNL
ncbi:uncharacterized protein LOC124648438 [Lolium rigidum]|uniref:uncharacterized protein LOC124648438 n=1 Tax=Lolium rigidum TaxID=89674 RepID=UPI001F5DAF3C|nr:uncharacterized protein LOC124648438 [Lolium rigidum]